MTRGSVTRGWAGSTIANGSARKSASPEQRPERPVHRLRREHAGRDRPGRSRPPARPRHRLRAAAPSGSQALAEGHELEGFLRMIGGARGRPARGARRPAAGLAAGAAEIAKAQAGKRAPLDPATWRRDDSWRAALARILDEDRSPTCCPSRRGRPAGRSPGRPGTIWRPWPTASSRATCRRPKRPRRYSWRRPCRSPGPAWRLFST